MLKKVGILAGLALVALAAWGGTMLWQYSQADKHLADAESYLEDERWREARSHLRQVLVWEPNHPQANLMMAKRYIAKKIGKIYLFHTL